MKNIGKEELVREMAEVSGLSIKDSSLALDAFMKTVNYHLAEGNKITLVKFGSFESKLVNERFANNPRDPQGEKIHVPAHIKPVFKFSPKVKEHLND